MAKPLKKTSTCDNKRLPSHKIAIVPTGPCTVPLHHSKTNDKSENRSVDRATEDTGDSAEDQERNP